MGIEERVWVALGQRGCAFVQIRVHSCMFEQVRAVSGFIVRDLCWFAIVSHIVTFVIAAKSSRLCVTQCVSVCG